MADDDIVHLIDDPRDEPAPAEGRRWKIAVIDDEPAVHDGTRFALSDYKLNGQGLEIVSAYSAAEGRELMRKHPDIAAVLLDVIMETDTAGLELVEFIRNQLKNETVRIILRTGQPGQAPERRVIIDYDINDYKAKTELTADKLFTAHDRRAAQSSTAPAHGRDPSRAGDDHRGGFDAVRLQVDATAGRGRAHPDRIAAQCRLRRHPGPARGTERARILLGAGGVRAATADSSAPTSRRHSAATCANWSRRHSAAGGTNSPSRRSVLYIKTGSGREVVVVLEAARQLSDTDRALVEIFCSRLSVAFDNVILYEQLQKANTRLEERVTERTRDLTNANRRLAAQWARLRQANTFKSEILGTVAHDLKNPLGVILGRTEILKEMIADAGALDEKVEAQIAYIRDAADRLTGMVDDLVSDAMADALDITIRREPVDISLLVQEVAEANQPLAQRKNQTITVTARPDHSAMCDSDRIREAIDNLVSNAVKYSPIGGAIDLLVGQQPTV